MEITAETRPHPLDPEQPRLSLNPVRSFKCYVNIKSTLPKLEWLCKNYKFMMMRELAGKITETLFSA